MFKELQDRELLQALLAEHRTATAVAAVIGCSQVAVSKACHRLGVDVQTKPHRKELNDPDILRELYARHGSLTVIAEVVGCTEAAVSMAFRRHGIEATTDGRFQQGHEAGPGWQANVGRGWTSEERAKSPRFQGGRHTDQARAAISAHNWSKTPEGREFQGQISKAAWERDDGTRRAASRERIRALHEHNRGKPSPNRKGFQHTCELPGCNEQFWVSPSRASYKRFCSRSHAAIAQNAAEYAEYDGFTFTLRQRIWQRDDGHCRWCGKDCSETVELNRRLGVVHHLDYDKANPDEGNLVLLCRNCHLTWHRRNAAPPRFAWAYP